MPCTSRTSIPTGRGWKLCDGGRTDSENGGISTHYEDAKDCSIYGSKRVRVTTDAVAPDAHCRHHRLADVVSHWRRTF